ncbi:ribosomal protein S18 acetylase RimI-like enzyme [Curtobacterium sp. PhB142]|uniref:GNAT family N-acetyltransferase n=1 Tax=unclassified Curtobacterium TaxID=257496 RepID=UPI00104B1DFB|nr:MULTISPECIES: GNAT family N-acetyltransferase [unclassified Curtobacterium]TCL86148.1 ribosomal protein S18 acetylase RimI-like enzyme [Curtobacterium sp. PhB142]TCM02338.1 ribosomal protein S18 acetylase RimI-like enzyme [Curtobacterium sp. PhB134]
MLHDLTLPVRLSARAGSVVVRNAADGDLDALMALLSDDPISAARGDVAAPEDRPQYAAALRSITDDPANALLVAEDESGRLVGTLQLTRIPGMARRGSTRLLVEAVRVSSALRSGGIGSSLMRWVTDVAAPDLGTPLVQLTSDAARTDAHRFYERLGFTGSHVGFKYRVPGVGADRQA